MNVGSTAGMSRPSRTSSAATGVRACQPITSVRLTGHAPTGSQNQPELFLVEKKKKSKLKFVLLIHYFFWIVI